MRKGILLAVAFVLVVVVAGFLPVHLLEGTVAGTKNAIAIGAACACVGFIVGATTLTGIGLKFATAIIAIAHEIAVFLNYFDFLQLTTVSDLTLFFTLVNTAFACFI